MTMVPFKAEKRILYVDDEPSSMVAAHKELKNRGFRVDLAHTRKDAEELLSKNRYDSVLLDLKLPLAQQDELLRDPARPENGLAILHSLRSGAFEVAGTCHEIPLFVVTSFSGDLKILEDVRRGGVKQIFTKPVQAFFLAETIDLALEEP